MPRKNVLDSFGKTIGARMKQAKLPDNLVCEDDNGKKIYKLVATVDSTTDNGGHFVAAVKTKQGWVEANDMDDSYPYGLKKRDSSPANITYSRFPVLALYELTEVIDKEGDDRENS